jgi:hypothetical protein
MFHFRSITTLEETPPFFWWTPVQNVQRIRVLFFSMDQRLNTNWFIAVSISHHYIVACTLCWYSDTYFRSNIVGYCLIGRKAYLYDYILLINIQIDCINNKHIFFFTKSVNCTVSSRALNLIWTILKLLLIWLQISLPMWYIMFIKP